MLLSWQYTEIYLIYSIYSKQYIFDSICLQEMYRGLLRGAVVKNPPANAGDTGSSPGPGRSHMLQSN